MKFPGKAKLLVELSRSHCSESITTFFFLDILLLLSLHYKFNGMSISRQLHSFKHKNIVFQKVY